ncbi:hypothetical protein BC826DRAFT_422290 [Russula brevipes]|nr:hypothetical protein BC826DRAFT_422290 [Russula brevipes]
MRMGGNDTINLKHSGTGNSQFRRNRSCPCLECKAWCLRDGTVTMVLRAPLGPMWTLVRQCPPPSNEARTFICESASLDSHRVPFRCTIRKKRRELTPEHPSRNCPFKFVQPGRWAIAFTHHPPSHLNHVQRRYVSIPMRSGTSQYRNKMYVDWGETLSQRHYLRVIVRPPTSNLVFSLPHGALSGSHLAWNRMRLEA